jgi:putative effector of murein hydrolase LrgA (UPF0299 family)
MKQWLTRIMHSKTMLFNILVAVMGVGEAAFGFLQPHIPGNVYGWGMALLTVGNAILRVVTTQPLRDK